MLRKEVLIPSLALSGVNPIEESPQLQALPLTNN